MEHPWPSNPLRALATHTSTLLTEFSYPSQTEPPWPVQV